LIARTPPLRGIARTPPLRGSFFIRWFANQEPRGRGLYLKNHPQIHQNLIDLGFVLQAGSSSSGFLVFKPPNEETTPGEVFSSLISPFVNIKDNLDITVNKILYRWLLLLNSFCFCET